MQHDDETALIHASRQGDSVAYGELVRRHQQAVFSTCYRVLHNRQDAEDMTQETFVRAFGKLHTFDVTRPFGAWVRRVAVNVCLNSRSRRQLEQVPLDEEWDSAETATPERTVIQRNTTQQLQAAITALPPHYRAVIELRHLQGLSYDDIAKTLDLPVNTVKSHLYRARKLLAERLKLDA